MLVEAFRTLVDRVDKHRSDASVAGDADSALDGVMQQGWAELVSLRSLIYREPGQHNDRHGIGHVAANIRGCELVRYGRGGHGVVAADEAIRAGYDKGAARPADLFRQSPPLDPIIKFSFAAGKGVCPMGGGQAFGWADSQTQAFPGWSPQGVLRAMSRSRPGFSATGASSNALNALKRSASRLKNT